MRDVADPVAETRLGDAGRERVLADVEQPLRLAVDRADAVGVGAVGDRAVEHDADVDRDQVAVGDAIRPGDAVDDHRVRRDADLGRDRCRGSPSRPRRRRARDERAGDVVELAGRDPRLEVLADVRDRRGDEVAGAGDPLDLLGALADDHGRIASSIWAKTSSTLAAASIVPERPGCPVALDDRLCLLMVDGEPPCHHLGRVVAGALPRARVRASERSPSRRRGRRRGRCRAAVPIASQHLVERLGLDEVARKAVEHEAADRVVLREPVADQRDRQLVGHELAGGEDRLDLAAELRSVGDRSAEHVARRHMGHAVGRGDPLRLRALPGSLRPENEDVDRRYLRKPS